MVTSHDILELLNVIFLSQNLLLLFVLLLESPIALLCFTLYPTGSTIHWVTSGKCEMLLNPGLKSLKLQELLSVEEAVKL